MEFVHKYNANSCDYDNSASIIMIFICFSRINGFTHTQTFVHTNDNVNVEETNGNYTNTRAQTHALTHIY